MLIRSARLEEIECLQSIGIEADTRYLQSQHPEFCDGTSIPTSVAAKAIEQQRLWVAEHQQTPVGWIYVSRLHGEYCIGQISVLTQHGQQGVGLALLQQAHADARRRGEASIVLVTQSDVPWCGPWYARMGYEAISQQAWSEAMQSEAQRQQTDGLDWANRIIMRLNLKS